MDGITSIRMSAGGTDFISGRNLIRWTEVFLMPSKNPERPIQDNDDPARAAGHLARAICMALTPNLAKLKSDELSPLAVRVNLDPDNVSFTIFQDFSVARILREIDFGEIRSSKTALFSILGAPNCVFLEFQPSST